MERGTDHGLVAEPRSLVHANAPAKLQRGHIRVMAKPSQINKLFVSFSAR